MARFTAAAGAGWAEALHGVASLQGPTRPATMLTRGFVVKVIARIPSLAPGASPRLAPSVAAAEEPSIAAACDRPTRRRREPTRFPVGSVAALALLAAVAWSLASWNDVRRLERARQDRIARLQAFQAAPGTVAR